MSRINQFDGEGITDQTSASSGTLAWPQRAKLRSVPILAPSGFALGPARSSLQRPSVAPAWSVIFSMESREIVKPVHTPHSKTPLKMTHGCHSPESGNPGIESLDSGCSLPRAMTERRATNLRRKLFCNHF